MFINSIDSILADFSKAADKLTKLAAVHETQSIAASARAQLAKEEQRMATDNASRAKAIAAKITQLIS